MTDPKRIHDALEQIAGESVPEDTNLWPQIRARAASQQQTQPVRVHPSRPAYRPSLRLAGAALALLLCVVLGITVLRGQNQPGGAPVIALLSTITDSPSPAADPTALAQSVNATVTAFQPQVTRTRMAQSTGTSAALQPSAPTSTPPAAATPFPPEVEVTDVPTEETVPTAEPTTARPVITGLGANRLGAEQTLNGITVRLDWAYLDERRLFFQYTVLGLPEDPGLDLRGAARVTAVTSLDTRLDVTGDGSGMHDITVEEGALIIREVREVQHTATEGALVMAGIDITAGGVTLPRSIIAADGTKTTVEGMEMPEAGVFHFDVSVPYYPALRLEPKQVVEAGGVRMELNWVKISASSAEAGVCFTVPSAGNWQFDSATSMQIGEYAPALIIEQGLDISQPDAEGTLNLLRRCLYGHFPALYDGASTTLTLSIPSIYTPADFVTRFEEARKTLAAQGIEIEKVPVNSGFEIRIIRRPDTMSEEEANRRLFEAAQQAQAGPWTFTIHVPGR